MEVGGNFDKVTFSSVSLVTLLKHISLPISKPNASKNITVSLWVRHLLFPLLIQVSDYSEVGC